MTTPSPTLNALLHHQGSLTAELEKLAGRALFVQVIKEHCRVLTFLEKKQLGLNTTKPQLAWERQVLLYGNNNQAWIKASSLFPLNTLKGKGKRFKNLKQIPIGYVLFKKNRKPPYLRNIYFDGKYWGRSTVYYYQNQPLLIDELFLNDFDD